MFLALKRAGVPAELHMYASAGTALACASRASPPRPGPSGAKNPVPGHCHTYLALGFMKKHYPRLKVMIP